MAPGRAAPAAELIHPATPPGRLAALTTPYPGRYYGGGMRSPVRVALWAVLALIVAAALSVTAFAIAGQSFGEPASPIGLHGSPEPNPSPSPTPSQKPTKSPSDKPSPRQSPSGGGGGGSTSTSTSTHTPEPSSSEGGHDDDGSESDDD